MGCKKKLLCIKKIRCSLSYRHIDRRWQMTGTKTDRERRAHTVGMLCMCTFFLYEAQGFCVVFYAVLYFEMRATLWMEEKKKTTEYFSSLSQQQHTHNFANTHSNMRVDTHTHYLNSLTRARMRYIMLMNSNPHFL